ncbi:MAG TPA: potassium channel family protein [Gaiellaceae bacterium]|nr:potassium channel family protein [Gaiellaceae bacterium]
MSRLPCGGSIKSFIEDPGSPRRAAWLIVVATILAVVLGGLVMWIFDNSEYPSLGRALWFTLQTVTTVGYGDVTPASPFGRVVAALVMLTAIGFITIITAAVTSTFVEAARRKRVDEEERDESRLERMETALGSIEARLERMEARLGSGGDSPPQG